MKTDHVIDTLNKLIETCKDGEYGFTACAEHVRSASVRQVFAARALECREAALELQQLVRQYGGKAEDEGSVSGAMHRGWVSVKGTLAGYSDVAMLEECERGEDAAVDRYRKALQQNLPADALLVVQRQMHGVQRNHEQIHRLRDEARASEHKA
ncbi:PA2169 family four-helix-bundle protein [Mitsuaria sp. WAJ17]|uniref:ferritin-like domain-containing protein n=1 Tax=Mitsuaria sp. WAJ17 TaxID=2761452 RepID=UPI001602C393|nr:PA2169 family four-helix-bundle protein [Mitsuaria sp. WAJ17]MBB2487647.1 PA2169 family four-helix-bundle protein [Mitsuaria sp. WAJ17]